MSFIANASDASTSTNPYVSFSKLDPTLDVSAPASAAASTESTDLNAPATVPTSDASTTTSASTTPVAAEASSTPSIPSATTTPVSVVTFFHHLFDHIPGRQRQHRLDHDRDFNGSVGSDRCAEALYTQTDLPPSLRRAISHVG